MKRKFSFNLAPVKIASRSDLKRSPEPTPSQLSAQSQAQSQSHRRHTSKDSVSDYTPYISRRTLDAQTERELRAACRLVLQNFKPSDHGMDDVDPKLDFGALQYLKVAEERAKMRHAQQAEAPKVRMPTGAPVDLKTALEARGLQQTDLTLKTSGATPVRANSSRKRSEFGWLDDRDDKREEYLRKSSSQRRRPAQPDEPAAMADEQAAEWMRQGREKASQDAVDAQGRPSTAARPPSRARSIKESIKEYAFPGTTSRSLSRAASTESLRTTNTRVSQESARDPPGSAGWRSWKSIRRVASRSSSRPGSSRGQSDDPEQSRKADANKINLNRELPPLPGLDTWKEPKKPQPEKTRSPKSAAHIASVMRPQEEQHQDRAAAMRKAHRRSGSDTLAMQFHAIHAARSPSYQKQHSEASHSKTLTPDSATAMGSMTLSGSASTSNLGHTRHKSIGSISTLKMSGELVNFSRNMSTDTPSRSPYPNEVKLSRKEEQKSRLKKVFSGWMRKKESKDDWMHRLEKEGVKEGVLVQDGAANAPIVRY